MEITIDGSELERILQYGSTNGDVTLERELTKLISRVHHRTRNNGQPDGDFALAIGSGSQDLLYKTISILFNPQDTVLVESPVYPYV